MSQTTMTQLYSDLLTDLVNHCVHLFSTRRKKKTPILMYGNGLCSTEIDFVLHKLATTISSKHLHRERNSSNLDTLWGNLLLWLLKPLNSYPRILQFLWYISDYISGSLRPVDIFSPSREQSHSIFVTKYDVITKRRV